MDKYPIQGEWKYSQSLNVAETEISSNSMGNFGINRKFTFTIKHLLYTHCGRQGGLMVSRLNGPGWSPGRCHCLVFLGKTLYSHCASLHSGVKIGTTEIMFEGGGGVTLQWAYYYHPIQGRGGGRNTPSGLLLQKPG